MRIRITMLPAHGDREQICIPLDFRRSFISLLKQMLAGSEAAERFGVDQPGFSPYVFSVSFKRIVKINKSEGKMAVIPPVKMEISTGIPTIMAALANGALQLYGKPTILGLKVDALSVMPLIRIKEEITLFKIMGHAVLRGKEGYLDPTNSTMLEIEEAINTHLFKHLDFLRPTYTPSGVIYGVSVVPNLSSYHKGVCTHYGGKLTTFQGKIALKGCPAALQFLYDFGLGVRTGQGFGLLSRI